MLRHLCTESYIQLYVKGVIHSRPDGMTNHRIQRQNLPVAMSHFHPFQPNIQPVPQPAFQQPWQLSYGVRSPSRLPVMRSATLSGSRVTPVRWITGRWEAKSGGGWTSEVEARRSAHRPIVWLLRWRIPVKSWRLVAV